MYESYLALCYGNFVVFGPCESWGKKGDSPQQTFATNRARKSVASTSMLAKNSLKALSLAMTITCFFRAGPFVWNSKSAKLSVHQKRRSKVVSYMVSAFICSHFVFIISRSVYALLVLGGSISKFLLQLTMVGQIGLSVSCNFNTLVRPYQMIEFTNQFLILDKQLTGNSL
jgi:hypothetical protein